MLASFIGFKQGADQILLICDRSLLAATLKRLSMFVLRAKCKLSDATADYQLYGLAGAAASAQGATAQPWSLASHNGASVITLYPALGQPRALWIAPAGSALPQAALPEGALPKGALPEGALLSPEAWDWSEVQSGVATLTAPLVDLFVPQMLNYESVGGVNFKKGCYPGQEIVARSQFRGTLKRRTYLAQSAQPITPGQEIFAAGDDEQPVGSVLQVATDTAGGYSALVCLQTAAEAAALHAGAPAGPALGLRPLPYALLEDI